jgi:hypothetical protein
MQQFDAAKNNRRVFELMRDLASARSGVDGRRQLVAAGAKTA